MKLYMVVTNDRLELPVAVADSPTKLARMDACPWKKGQRISEKLWRGDHKKGPYKVVVVEV